MTTIRKIVTKAFRESGVIAVGSEPEAEEFAEGLDTLNTMLLTLFGHQLGEPLEDFYSPNLNENDAVSANYRIVLNDTSPTTIKLDEYPAAGARVAIIDNLRNLSTYPLTIDANGKRIDGGAVTTVSTAGANQIWFYRDDLAEWVSVGNIEANGNSPLPAEFDDFLVTMLAWRLNPRFGAQTSEATLEVLKTLQSQFSARYKQSRQMDSELGLLNLSYSNRRGTTLTNFNTGH
jgi:hypothetical protein